MDRHNNNNNCFLRCAIVRIWVPDATSVLALNITTFREEMKIENKRKRKVGFMHSALICFPLNQQRASKKTWLDVIIANRDQPCRASICFFRSFYVQ